ncbi:hypothetical protein N9F66_01545 [bacterium]|nr:hypothetical protein [bacterium]
MFKHIGFNKSLQLWSIHDTDTSDNNKLSLQFWDNNTHNVTVAKNLSNIFNFSVPMTVYISSCGRWDHLINTIKSFEKQNTYQYIVKRFVMDDSIDFDGLQATMKTINNHLISVYGGNSLIQYEYYSTEQALLSLSNNTNVKIEQSGRTRLYKSKDETYRKYIDTEWVFYTQEDFFFYKPYFIEKSLAIHFHCINNPKLHWPIYNVHLVRLVRRPTKIHNMHYGRFNMSVLHNVTIAKNYNVSYYVGRYPRNNCFVSYSNWPSVVSKSKYYIIDRHARFGDERQIACFFLKKLHITGAIMPGDGFVEHTGLSDSLIGTNWLAL